MSILLFSEEVYLNLEKDLDILTFDGENKLIQFESANRLVDEAMLKLKGYMEDYEFSSDEEEIDFFKNKMTSFLKESVFYSELFNMESIKPPGTKKQLKRFYERELFLIKGFLRNNQNLYNYLLLKKENQDKVFFLRRAEVPVYKPNLFRYTLDTRFCTVYTLYFAKIKGILELSQYIYEQIRQLDVNEPSSQSAKRHPLIWTGAKVELVELVYALKATGVFNHGRADIKEIATAFEVLFNRDLKDCYRTFQEIGVRKKNRTVFMDFCKSKLDQYLEQSESLQN